jgi:hypothetical protein
MSDDPTSQGPSVRRDPAHASKRSFNWKKPGTWTIRQRWSAGIGAAAIILVIALVALLVGGSGGKAPVKTAGSSTPTTSPSATTTAHQTTKPGPPVCPLTGTTAPGGKVSRRPALVFKVDNYPTARPWSGIDKADIVFEEPVEGFITRLAAVFQCQEAPLIGPIRSARQPDQGIGDLLSHPIWIHVGAINPVTDLLDASNLTNIDLRFEPYSNIEINPPGREAPYDTYASTSGGWGLVPKDTTPPAAIFQYSKTVPNGKADSSLSINFSSTSDETWSYNSATHAYTLSYADTGPALVSLPSGQQSPIATSNIVVQVVHYTIGPWVENAEGGLEVMVDPTGSGPLEVFRDGVFVRGTWSRSSLSSPLKLAETNGSPIKLKPGTTWVEIVPTGLPVIPTP